MPKFGAIDIKFGVRLKCGTYVKVWHNKFLSIMDENVTWMSYKKALLQRFGKSIDGPSREFSSSKSVRDSSLYSGLVDKLEELLWVKEVTDPIEDKRVEYSDKKEPFEMGSRLVDDVAVEAVTSSVEVENRLVDDVVMDKDGGSNECETSKCDQLLNVGMETQIALETTQPLLKCLPTIPDVNEHTKFSSVGCIQKDANLLDICFDLRYVEGWEYGNKGCKVATCDDLLHTNVKQKGNLEKETTCFAHMSSRTRNESSVSQRIKDTCNIEILTYSLEVGSVKESARSDFDESYLIVYLEADENNGDNFGCLKFAKWKWLKRSRKGAKCKVKNRGWRFSDIFVLKLDESDDERVTGNGLETKVIETSLGIEYLENFLVAASSSGSSSNSQNVAFVSAESTNSTNELNAAYCVSTATGHSSQAQGSSSYADELMFLFFTNQSSSPQLDNEDLEQINQDDLEEMDLKWQVAMISMRVKRFYKKTRRKLEFNGKEPVGFDKTKVECFNCHRRGNFARDCRIARNSGNMSRDDENAGYKGRDNGKRLAREKDEKALVVQDRLGTYDWSYQVEEEATDFALMAFTLNPSSSSSLNSEVQSCSKQCVQSYEQLKNLFDEQLEKLRKANLEIVGYQYGLESIEGQLRVYQQNEVIYEEKIGVLEYDIKDKKEEVTETVFDNRSSDEENSLANDRFKKGERYHAVPPPLTGNYMPPKYDLSFAGLDEFIYKFKRSKTVTSFTKDAFETSTAFVEKTKEVRTTGESVKPIKSVKHVKPVKTAEQIKKLKNFSSSPTSDRKYWNGKMTQKLGMAKKSVLPNNVRKETGHKESRSVWNNAQRINHQNKFALIAVFIRSGRIPVNVAKPKVAASTSGHPHQALKNKGIVDIGCSRHMTGNKAYLADYQEINDGGFVAFGSSRDKITGKGKIRTEKLDFDYVYFVNELQFNLFSVSQMCGKKNSVLFTETECLVLSPNFKLLDESQILLRIPRQSNIYSFDLQNVVLSRDLTCLFSKSSIDESNLWHRMLGYVNFKTMNKLVKGNLVRGLPLRIFENDHTCVACQKRKQHKAACKAKFVSSISQPLQMLHMDLFCPTSVMSINHKKYYLVVTDDFSRDLDEFCGMKGIKREYRNARTPQQNKVTERKNKTLIKAARTMLADSLLPIIFWVEAVNTACYVLNTALVIKSHNKTPYELLNGRKPRLDFIRPFGCPVTILNALDPLEKFEGKADEGFLVGYYVTSKAFREVPDQYSIVFPLWSSISFTFKSSDDKAADDKPKDDIADALRKEFEQGCMDQRGAIKAGSTHSFNTISNLVNAASTSGTFSVGGPSSLNPNAFNPANTLLHVDQNDSQLPDLEDTVELRKADFNNMESSTVVSPIPTHRVHIDHLKDQILRDPKSAVQTRGMAKKSSGAYAFVSYVHKQRRTN
uniref:Integrase catalytic domain-containing protein n=1 Tax=Tanacetum cinerariifolium TaxID=118510 RepID=A0A6L2MEN0_TANCI|nr:hypothetical protein [Tanacetum cinerariifolium]